MPDRFGGSAELVRKDSRGTVWSVLQVPQRTVLQESSSGKGHHGTSQGMSGSRRAREQQALNSETITSLALNAISLI